MEEYIFEFYIFSGQNCWPFSMIILMKLNKNNIENRIRKNLSMVWPMHRQKSFISVSFCLSVHRTRYCTARTVDMLQCSIAVIPIFASRVRDEKNLALFLILIWLKPTHGAITLKIINLTDRGTLTWPWKRSKCARTLQNTAAETNTVQVMRSWLIVGVKSELTGMLSDTEMLMKVRATKRFIQRLMRSPDGSANEMNAKHVMTTAGMIVLIWWKVGSLWIDNMNWIMG